MTKLTTLRREAEKMLCWLGIHNYQLYYLLGHIEATDVFYPMDFHHRCERCQVVRGKVRP